MAFLNFQKADGKNYATYVQRNGRLSRNDVTQTHKKHYLEEPMRPINWLYERRMKFYYL